jgi:hypothetical protein
MDAPYEEVRSAYADGNLRKFFTRSDTQQTAKTRTRSGRQAVLETMAMHPNARREPPPTPAQMRKQLTDMAMPQPASTLAERHAELTAMAMPYQTAASVGLHG